MVSGLKGATEGYLADLERIQQQMQQAETQMSSGLKIRQPSDGPAAIVHILQTQTDLAQTQQIQSNLGNVKTEVDAADSSLQSAIQGIENAIALAAQGASSTATADERTNLAEQVSGLQETMVGISRTTVGGRYIFSGDQDAQPAYQLDLTQPEGVQQLLSAPATRLIQDGNGAAISVARTAQEIFDARDPGGSPAAGNVFNALNLLRTALLNNDQAGIAQAADALHAADDHLNSQLAFYGQAQNRIADATSLAQKFQTAQEAELSQLRDADIPTVATQLTQAQVQEQASLAVQATVSQTKNLFNYLA